MNLLLPQDPQDPQDPRALLVFIRAIQTCLYLEHEVMETNNLVG